MAELHQENVGSVGVRTKPASMTPNTDPENGQLLQPETGFATASPMMVQGDQYLDKVLSKIRSDSVYELRKLQHQHKPVSEFGSKSALEELLERRRHAPADDSIASAAAIYTEDSANSEVNRSVQHFSTNNGVTSSTQEYMPPSVRLEIRGLIEREYVSGALNSAHAGEIERSLQEGLERLHRNQQMRRTPTLPGRAEDGRLQDNIQGRNYHSPRPGANQRNPPPRQPENGQYRMPQRDQSSIVRQLQESPALNSLEPSERDRVLTEVNHLVQQQLVTSALSGEFRRVLELHIRNRADQVRNGTTVADITHSLQRRSDHSATNARQFDPEVPSSAAMSEMQQELRDARSEIQELKQLMRTSFDLQLEIQRAIRQEVAAALSSVCSPSSSISIASITTGVQNVVNSGNCVICSEASINSVVYRCGHMCVCMHCGLELKAQGLKCPICRAPITDIIRAYSSMQ